MKIRVIRQCVLTVLLSLISQVSFSAASYEPFLKGNSGAEVCELALKHAQNYFRSTEKTYPNLSTSSVVSLPVSNKIKVNRFPDDKYALTDVLSVYKLEFLDKSLIYVNIGYWFGYVNHYSSHLLEVGELDVFLESYKKKGVDQGINNSYSMPFQYRGRWYLDDGDQNARTIYSISSDQEFKQECLITIKDVPILFDTLSSLDFLSAYHDSVQSILRAPWGHSGTSKAPLWAKNRGRAFILEALTRPWTVSANPLREMDDYGLMPEYQRAHMAGWQYQDVWSHREYKTYEMLAIDAQNELSDYYIDEFSIPEEVAASLAQKVIDSIAVAYYSLSPSVVDHELKNDFSYLEPVTKYDYSILDPDELSLRVHHVPALSLLLDAPAQFIEFASGAGYWYIKDDEVLPTNGTLDEYYHSYYGKDMLMYAAHMNNLDAVKYLVELGWSLDKYTAKTDGYFPYYPTINHRSALTYAVENGSLELIAYLVDQGAEIYIWDSKQNNLDFYLAKNPNFTEQQKKAGLKVLLESYDGSKVVEPGFSCDGSLRKLERLICDNPGLAIYDRELNKRYRTAMGTVTDPAILQASQKNWLKNRNKVCGTIASDEGKKACLASTSRHRLRYLEYLNRDKN